MNNPAANKMEEAELLTEVPPILKRLAKTVAYAFYEPEHYVTLTLLIKYPVIDEDSLIEKLQFDKRQMRQTLSRLRNDKLVKQRVVKEKIPETGNFNIFNFYFINYKLFVNVVKYKLDHIRRKLESEEQQIRNRPSFQCQDCEKHFSDLDVGGLLDLETGELKCSFCSGAVEEDPMQVNSLESGSSLGKFNEQMETIFNLLKECENINLAPDVLEPTPSTEGLANKPGAKANSGAKGPNWASGGPSVDLYDQRIQINVGDEVVQNATAKPAQELPKWITHSTVFNEQIDTKADSASVTQPAALAEDSKQTSRDIMSDLLAHENEKKKPRLELPAEQTSAPTSTKISPETGKLADVASGITEVADMGDSDEDDDDDDNDEDDDDDSEGVTIKVGDKSYELSDITDDVVKQMSEEEHQAYLKIYNDMAAQFY